MIVIDIKYISDLKKCLYLKIIYLKKCFMIKIRFMY